MSAHSRDSPKMHRRNLKLRALRDSSRIAVPRPWHNEEDFRRCALSIVQCDPVILRCLASPNAAAKDVGRSQTFASSIGISYRLGG